MKSPSRKNASTEGMSRGVFVLLCSFLGGLVFLIGGISLVLSLSEKGMDQPEIPSSTSALFGVFGLVYSAFFAFVASLVSAVIAYVVSGFICDKDSKKISYHKMISSLLVFMVMTIAIVGFLYSQVIKFDSDWYNEPGIKKDLTVPSEIAKDLIEKIKDDEVRKTIEGVRELSGPKNQMFDLNGMGFLIKFAQNKREWVIESQSGEEIVHFRIRAQYPNIEKLYFLPYSSALNNTYFFILAEMDQDEEENVLYIFDYDGEFIYEEIYYQ